MEPNRIFKRYVSVWNRKTDINSKVVEWDIAGHSLDNPVFVCIFPFDTKSVIIIFNVQKKITSLLLEYAQGPDEILYTFPSGSIGILNLFYSRCKT